MLESMFKRTFSRRSWCATLSAVLLASCGGSGDEVTSAPTSAPTTGVQSTTDTVLASTAVSNDPAWHFCVNEGQTCTFAGTRLIRYGADGKYVYKTATGSIGCNNTVFGDPIRGVVKSCWISTTPSPYNQDAALYTLTFRDEFNGTALDTNKWRDYIWYEQSATTHDYGVEGGYLKIWPERNAAGNFANRILVTQGKFEQAYGYFEMEAKLPIGKGVWPAFWLLNSDDPDHGEPEIDIMEAYPGDKDNNGYWGDANKHPIRYDVSVYSKGNGEGVKDEAQTNPYTGDLSTGFHKYAVKWEPNKISFYFDGKLVESIATQMSRKMYILLDIQYGNDNASGDPDETTPTGPGNSFAINYVRAWQFK